MKKLGYKRYRSVHAVQRYSSTAKYTSAPLRCTIRARFLKARASSTPPPQISSPSDTIPHPITLTRHLTAFSIASTHNQLSFASFRQQAACQPPRMRRGLWYIMKYQAPAVLIVAYQILGFVTVLPFAKRFNASRQRKIMSPCL